MWYIAIIVGIILIKFIGDTNAEKKKISANGGINIKYSRLIELLLQGDSRARIFHQDELSISLGLVVTGASSKYTITQNYGEVLIEYQSKSNIYEDFKMEWHFSEDLSQEKMFEKICNDISKKKY